jgi:hypothetical protein
MRRSCDGPNLQSIHADCFAEGTLEMVCSKIAFAALLLFTTAVGTTTLSPISPAMAQASQSAVPHELRFGAHIEGHIAFLKAELNITPAQETLWSKVAEAMRADVADFDQLKPQTFAKMQRPPTALQHLEERAAYTALRAKGEQRFLEAFRPLYEQLSDAQKLIADELLGQRHEAP